MYGGQDFLTRDRLNGFKLRFSEGYNVFGFADNLEKGILKEVSVDKFWFAFKVSDNPN